jgi:hypothetical protein
MNRSPLRIDKEGRWFFHDEEITHRRTYLLFSQNLTRDESGRTILRIGQEQCPVEVEDVPFVVKTLDFVLSDGGELKSIWLTLNDETREQLNQASLRIGAENVPYCRVRSGKFEARFSRGAYQLLLPYIQQDEKANRFFIHIDGKEQDLTTLPPCPDR